MELFGSAKKDVVNCRYFISENGCRAAKKCKRSKPETLTLAEKGTQVIVPTGAMTEVGYVNWSNGKREVAFMGVPVEAKMIGGCPVVEEGIVLRMIGQMEMRWRRSPPMRK